MELDLIINQRITIPGAELTVTATRSSGPGGQHVNKTSSRISLRWNILTTVAFTDDERSRVMKRLQHRITTEGDILIHVETERSQIQNRRIARERLVALIKDGLFVNKKRIATKPSARAKTKRIQAKKLRGIIKQSRRAPTGDA